MSLRRPVESRLVGVIQHGLETPLHIEVIRVIQVWIVTWRRDHCQYFPGIHFHYYDGPWQTIHGCLGLLLQIIIYRQVDGVGWLGSNLGEYIVGSPVNVQAGCIPAMQILFPPFLDSFKTHPFRAIIAKPLVHIYVRFRDVQCVSDCMRCGVGFIKPGRVGIHRYATEIGNAGFADRIRTGFPNRDVITRFVILIIAPDRFRADARQAGERINNGAFAIRRNIPGNQAKGIRIRLCRDGVAVAVVDVTARRGNVRGVQVLAASQLGQDQAIVPLDLPIAIFQDKVHINIPGDVAEQERCGKQCGRQLGQIVGWSGRTGYCIPCC